MQGRVQKIPQNPEQEAQLPHEGRSSQQAQEVLAEEPGCGDLYRQGQLAQTLKVCESESECQQNGNCFFQGLMYSKGCGVEQDSPRAAGYCSKACSAGTAEACFNLALNIQNGNGIKKDPTRAAAYMLRACETDYDAGCTALGRQYEHGTGVKHDCQTAHSLYQKACDLDNASG